jgi:hypothetical protein
VLGKTIATAADLRTSAGGSGSDVHSLPFTLNALRVLGTGCCSWQMGSGLTLRRFLRS